MKIIQSISWDKCEGGGGVPSIILRGNECDNNGGCHFHLLSFMIPVAYTGDDFAASQPKHKARKKEVFISWDDHHQHFLSSPTPCVASRIQNLSDISKYSRAFTVGCTSTCHPRTCFNESLDQRWQYGVVPRLAPDWFNLLDLPAQSGWFIILVTHNILSHVFRFPRPSSVALSQVIFPSFPAFIAISSSSSSNQHEVLFISLKGFLWCIQRLSRVFLKRFFILKSLILVLCYVQK